jgi:8-oxo-dGTP diphosphatase
MKYVLGFMFDRDYSRVALIRKNSPEFQRDKYNGIGGKMEKDEYPVQALVREFFEETGMKTSNSDWRRVAVFYGPHFEMQVFSGREPEHQQVEWVRTTTKELVQVFPVSDLPSNMLMNVRWLIPLCINTKDDPDFEYIVAHYS